MTRFWFWAYRLLWHTADWVLTSRLLVPRDHPLRTQVFELVNKEVQVAERQRLEAAFRKGLPHV